MTTTPSPGRNGRSGVVLGITAGVLALAVAGFLIGFLLHGDGGANSTSGAPSSPPAAASASPAAPVTLAPLALPNYQGQDFTQVRAQLRDLQMGVQLVFAAQGDSPAVDHTVPAAGSPVDRGLTIKVYVTGAAPLLSPPDVVGQPCNDGGKALADAGLSPRYPAGRSGTVTAQDPAAGAPGVHWNDQVQVTCGVAASDSPSG